MWIPVEVVPYHAGKNKTLSDKMKGEHKVLK